MVYNLETPLKLENQCVIFQVVWLDPTRLMTVVDESHSPIVYCTMLSIPNRSIQWINDEPLSGSLGWVSRHLRCNK